MSGTGSEGARRVLVTGFEPYGGRGRNPSAEIAKALDGRSIAGCEVVGRTLPVSYCGLPERLDGLLDETRPTLVISLGLWPGEAMIRLERFGLNLAHFEIPDNDGLRVADAAIAANGETALPASLPLRAIEAALHEAGIPAVLSSTAGTFLCNVTLYTLMRLLAGRAPAVRGGFIHVPYMPEQVAETLAAVRAGARLELHQRADLASMELARMVRAIEIAIAVSLRERAEG